MVFTMEIGKFLEQCDFTSRYKSEVTMHHCMTSLPTLKRCSLVASASLATLYDNGFLFFFPFSLWLLM